MVNGCESVDMEENREDVDVQQGDFLANRSEEISSSQSPVTTTIGTIALQSGDTRLVIALLQSGEWLRLKVLEIQPELTKLGSSPEEATELSNAHGEVLLRLQTKQSPVEELLRQADRLISTQKPKAEVYKAMADTLANAWRDVNSLLERRKIILERNVLFQCRAEECKESMKALEMACNDTLLPIEIEAVKNFLGKIHDLRKVMLETLMAALQEGKILLDRLKEISNEGTLDSRPDRIKHDADHAIQQVETWLEELHDRRRLIEISFKSRKTQLEQCLALALLATDLRNLEDILNVRISALSSTSDHLGDSSASAELLLFECKKLQIEAKDFQDRAIKITKSTERLVSSGHFAGEQATEQSYAILGAAADYINDLEQYKLLLNRAVLFFEAARSALTKIDQLEIQLVTTEHSPHTPGFVRLHAQVVETLEDITRDLLEEGHALLEITGRGAPGAEGVKRMVEEIEDRKIRLLEQCTAHKEENIRITQCLQEFLEKYSNLRSWLSSIVESFLRGHQDMGSDLRMAKDFYQLHCQLLNDLERKSFEVQMIDCNVMQMDIFPNLDAIVQRDIDDKMEALRNSWILSKKALEARVRLGSLYVDFHQAATTLDDELNLFEIDLKNNAENLNQMKCDQLEEKWRNLQPYYLRLTAAGKSFLDEGEKIMDSYLDVPRACLCVETTLERFSNRQFTITKTWENWQTAISILKERRVEKEKRLEESTKTLEWVSKFREQLYPVITSESTESAIILHDLSSSRSRLLPELNKAVSELDGRIKGIDVFERGDDFTDQQIRNQLSQVSEQLRSTAVDYQTLLESLISVFENLSEIERKTDQQIRAQDISHLTYLPKEAVREVKNKIERHEIESKSITEALTRVESEIENVILRIERQEPADAARQDIQKLKQVAHNVNNACKSSWSTVKSSLAKDLQVSSLREDLEKIDRELQDLCDQLKIINTNLGENLPSAKKASDNFIQFEKTLMSMESKVKSFIESIEENMPKYSSIIQHELSSLREKMQNLKTQTEDTRNRKNSNIEYFELLDETKDWFKEGSKLLLIIARKSSSVKLPQEAIDLLNDIDKFLKPGEDNQERRIERIRELSTQIFGTDRLPQFNELVVENREMLDSFAVVGSELRTLVENLKNAEYLRAKMKKEQDEVDAKLEEAKKEVTVAQAAAAEAEETRKITERLTVETLEKAAEEAKRLAKINAEKEHEKCRQIAASAQTETTNFLIDERLIKETILKETSAITTKEILILQKTEFEDPMPIIEKQQMESTLVNEEIVKKEDDKFLLISEAPRFTVKLDNAIIQEGEQFTFKCHVIGYPEPEVVWLKDGMSIINNPDYLTDYNQGICTLTIEETFTEDSAKFTCKASNDAGSTETDAVLTVKETAAEELPRTPNFIKELQSSIAIEGSTYELNCKVDGNPLPTVLWFKNEINIDNSPDYIITYNNGEGILKFEQIFMVDQANYSCKATNRLGDASTSCFLTIQPLVGKIEETEKPQIILAPENIKTIIGEKVELICEAVGKPMPTFLWSHEGIPIEETSNLKIETNGGRSSLVIAEVFLKDAGSYLVIVKNSIGETTATCNISVKNQHKLNDTNNSESLFTDMKPMVPSIQLPLKDVQIKEGESARLDCIIIGHPEPEVIWYHDDRPVKESADFQLLFQGDRCSLLIHEAFLDDSGLYKVVAINSSGEASSECSLSISPRESTKKPESPPVFVKLLTDLLVAEGEESIFECLITGEPKSEIKWYLNGDEIIENNRIKITQEENGTHILRISSTLPDDKGNYIAKATNRLGEAKAFAKLVVRVLGDFQKKDELVRMEEKLLEPSFKERFDNKSVLEGVPVKFECIVSGKPVPKIQWLFNNRPVHGKDFLVSVSGERQVLSIPQAAESHRGIVSCVAENAAGKAICSAQLDVGVGVQEEGFEIVQVPNNEMHASSSSEKHFTTERTTGEGGSESQILTKMSSSLTESSSSHSSMKKEYVTSTCSSTLGTTGHQPSNYCVKQTTQSSEHSSSQNGAPPVVQCQKIQEYEKIFQDRPGEVKQDRTIIITEDTEITKHVCKPCRKQTAPRFVSPVTGMIVDQATDVVLEGIVDGFPQPTVTWAKNNQELRTKDGVKMSYQQNHARLELKNVNVKDAGRYTCTAVNSVGNASSTADLVVKKTIFPPVFGRRLQAQVVKHGDRVMMEVEITGTPEPTVRWYKDDVPLRERPPEIRMKQQGNCYLLLIDKADKSHAGKYMVHATNAGGEAQSIADFAVFEPTPDTMVEVHKTLVYENVQDKDVVEPDEMKAKIPSANMTTQHITTTMIQPSAALKTPIPPTSSCSTIRTIQSESDTKASRSETISSTIESHRSETKSEQKFHMKLEHKAAPLFEGTSGDLEYAKPSKDKKTTIETKKEEMTADGKLIEREIKTYDEEATLNENVETSTVAKKDALNFFEAMSKGSDNIPKGPKDMIKLTENEVGKGPGSDVQVGKLTKNYERTTRFEEVKEPKPDFKTSKKAVQDIFSKFEQSSTSRGIENNLIEFPYEGYKLPPLEIKRTILEDVTASGSPIHGTLTISKLEAQSESAEAMLKGFNLVPEPPPEIGYAPAEGTKKKLPDVSIKAKQLQESFDKSLSPVDAPIGGVKMFPSSKPETKSFTRPATTPEKSLSIPPPFELNNQQVIEETCIKKDIHEHKTSSDSSEYRCQSTTSMQRSISPKPKPPREITRTLTDHQEWKEPGDDFKLTTKETTKEVEVTPAGRCATTSIESTTSLEKQSWSSQENRFVEKTVEQPPKPKPIIYKAETTKVDHTISTIQEKSLIEKYSSECDVHKSQTTEKMIESIEQRCTKPCPASSDLKAPSLVKNIESKKQPTVQMYHQSQSILQPGPPPEIGFSPGPALREKKIEKIEKTLEMSLGHQPAKIPPGAVRIAPPVPPKDLRKTPPLSSQPKLPPTCCTPTKFTKTSFYSESEYESDLDGTLRSKWRPYESDSEEPRYRRVTAPIPKQPRPKSTEPEPLPPSRFEIPSADLTAPSRPLISDYQEKSTKKTMTRQERDYKQQQQQRFSQTPPVLPKPGSPPIYVHPTNAAPRPAMKLTKPESPKFKTKMFQPESGYMADTDEPFQYLQQQQQQKMSTTTGGSGQKGFTKHEESSMSSKMMSESRSCFSESHSSFTESKNYTNSQKSESSKSCPFSQSLPTNQVQRTSYIEKSSSSIPTKDTFHSVSHSEQWKSQPSPSPSKFVRSEFRESDYESDFDSRRSTLWKSQGSATIDRTHKSVKSNLTSTGKPRPASWAEPSLPTPPVLIESTKESIKKDISHQGDKSKSKSVLLPGSPPEIAYAPPVTESRQTYYEGRTGTPFHNAVGTELKKTVRMDESTENTRRILTVEQTSRVIKFGDKSNKSYETSTNEHCKNSYNVPMPKKFVQGQFRESDYESDIDAGKIRPKWTPADSDTEEPRYRKVQAPRISRPRSIGPIQSTTPIVTLPSESENERSETDMRSSSMTTQRLINDQSLKPGSPPEFGYSSGQELRQTANHVATKHMSDMTSSFKSKTEKFVHDIQSDLLKKRSKPILKHHSVDGAVTDGDDDPRTYREEKRLSQYGSPWPCTNGISGNKEVIQPYLEPQPKKAPLFITPLRDIAVVSGQSARFECIVQAEPQPNILWSKNGRIVENSAKYEIYYRNGVCRLTLARALPDDAGTFTCTATNNLGSAGTSSTLQVPGNRRSVYGII
ncbi:muscle M-line assembly protein unc-89 isoform X2 [Leptopilina boulardi]|uniref:muscle M-line assembly protein unc-89 isoform X2 n=1 Tax=Leptopilina boulardi TaxID=63433 RepID=UPI0021F66718|nr:muscle M-line assembly protein unc-89 isoform X2 [Leptopilina boulardi]